MGDWVVLEPPTLELPSSTLYQPVLSVATDYKVNNSEGIPLSSYKLERWGKIFHVLKSEDQQTPMLPPEGIKISKIEGVKVDKRVVPLIESAPKEISLNVEGDTMVWLSKFHCHEQQEKGELRKDQKLSIGYVLKFQAPIGR